LALSGCLLAFNLGAQITNVVFSDDFTGSSLDSSKWVIDSPMFEGGKGTIAPQQHDGVIEFTGEVTEQWWAGATVRALKTFSASAETNVIVSVDRVAEAGQGTASRSALWIMDATRTKYVLFADVRAEGGWRYNRKILQSGDVPTGSGTDIAAYNGATWDDSGLHSMRAVLNGKTVRLFLDGKIGPEIKFPFSEVVFQIGSYARANGDTAGTVFDNFQVMTVGAAAFSTTTATLLSGQTLTYISVRIPPGVNNTANVTVRVTTSDPAVAVPEGATGDTLALTFPAGGSNEQFIRVKSVGPPGSATFSLANDIGMNIANTLSLVVIQEPGVRLADDFSGADIDTAKWVTNMTGFEATGMGTFNAGLTGGALVINGTVDTQGYWPGLSLQTVPVFTATADLPLVFEMDRVSIDPTQVNTGSPSTGARAGVFIETADRSQYVFFAQNLETQLWEANVNPGNPTGSGTALAAFSEITGTNSHRMKIMADGTQAELFLDGVSGGRFDFPVNAGIHFDIGAYARDYDDSVKGVFDNVTIKNMFPPIKAAPTAVSTIMGVNAYFVTVTIPRLLNLANPVAVTVTSENPAIAIPEGAVDGKLTLTFAAGTTNARAFKVITAGPGATVFKVATDQAVEIANNVNVNVTPPPVVFFSDDFSAAALDAAKWNQDSTPLVTGGAFTADSAISITNGMLLMHVWCEAADWPGFSIFARTSFTASATSPSVFEVDRVDTDFTLIGGDASKQRTGMWIKDSTTNYVFFSQLESWNAIASGWQYHRVIGQKGDNPITAADAGNGTYMNQLNTTTNLNQGLHRMRAEANGKTVKLYLDGELGAEVSFPVTNGITYGIGTFANFSNSAGNRVWGFYDNANVFGYPAVAPAPKLTATRQTNGDVVISWTGTGLLQSANSLTGTGSWTDVSPAPVGSSVTISAGTLKQQQYYRLR
jgi:hypothetical protein